VFLVLPVGPVIQDRFLHNMGVVLRLQVCFSALLSDNDDFINTHF